MAQVSTAEYQVYWAAHLPNHWLVSRPEDIQRGGVVPCVAVNAANPQAPARRVMVAATALRPSQALSEETRAAIVMAAESAQWITLREAAQRSGREPSTLRRAAIRGTLRAVRRLERGGYVWYTTEADLAAYLARARRRAPDQPAPRR